MGTEALVLTLTGADLCFLFSSVLCLHSASDSSFCIRSLVNDRNQLRERVAELEGQGSHLQGQPHHWELVPPSNSPTFGSSHLAVNLSHQDLTPEVVLSILRISGIRSKACLCGT